MTVEYKGVLRARFFALNLCGTDPRGQSKLNQDVGLKISFKESTIFLSIVLVFYWAHGPWENACQRLTPTHEASSSLKKSK